MHFSSKTIAKLVGMILMILGIAMLPSLICALCTSDQTCLYAFGISTPLSFGIGLCMYLLIPRSRKGLLQRDGYLAVVVCWISGAVIGALPYILSGFLPHFYDAFFESMSGLSTTGATVTRASMPAALILWKAMMHWLGGMGILIFIIAILPALGVGGQRIASAEAPGSELAKMSPRINDISKMLYLIYSTMTGIEFLLLWLGSTMGPFEALVNTLGSISTAGLLYHQGAVSAYQSLFVELVISIFTIFSSTNFIVYISLITKSFKQIAHNIEVRTYFGIIAAASILIAIILKVSGTCATFGSALRHGFFQAATFASTSGFYLDDYTSWPISAQIILFTLMFIGGCAASTSGSLKVFRLVIMVKLIKRGAYRRIHPHAVRSIRIGDTVITSRLASAVTSFAILFGVTFVLSSIVISLSGCSLETATSTAISLMSTTGGSFGAIGAEACYNMFAPGMKLFLSLLMMVGRLELFTVFIMFSGSFWNPNRAT